MSTNASHPRWPAILTAIPFAIMALWLGLQFNTALNSDHAWLIEAASRLLQGGTMSTDFFDPNPPLSILLYIPAALLKMIGLVPLGTAHYFITTLVVLIFGIQLTRVLQSFETLDSGARTVLIFAFFASNSFLTMAGQFYFGERDQFIWMGLALLSLYQLRLHNQPALHLSGLDIAFMALSVLFILLKPHYLIIPALFLMARAVKYKSARSLVFSVDTYCLCAVSLAYLVTVAVFFPDYFTEILPLLLDVYIKSVNPDIVVSGFIYCSLPLINMLFGLLIGLPFKELKAPFICLALSLICGFLFWIQMKNIYYQLIPCLGFWFIGVALLVIKLKERYLRYVGGGVLTIIIFTLMALAYFIAPPKTALSHQDYQSTQLYGLLQSCAPDCSYFMFAEDMDIIHQLGLYTGAKHASRFPVLWGLKDALSDQTATGRKWRQMVLDDIERDKPAFLIIVRDITLNQSTFDLLSYLSGAQNAQALDPYQKSQTIEEGARHYLGPAPSELNRILVFDIFERQK